MEGLVQGLVKELVAHSPPDKATQPRNDTFTDAMEGSTLSSLKATSQTCSEGTNLTKELQRRVSDSHHDDVN